MSKSIAHRFATFAAMLAFVAVVFAPTHADATGKPPDPAPAPTPTTASSANAGAAAASQSKAAIDLSLVNSATGGAGGAGGLGGAGGAGGLGGNGAGGSVSQGHTYVMPAPAAAAPLPAGLCPQGDSAAYSVLWGLVSWANSSTRTEMVCLDKVLAMLRDTAPKPIAPVPGVVNYLSALPHPQPAEVAPVAIAPVAPAAVACVAPPGTAPSTPAAKAVRKALVARVNAADESCDRPR